MRNIGKLMIILLGILLIASFFNFLSCSCVFEDKDEGDDNDNDADDDYDTIDDDTTDDDVQEWHIYTIDSGGYATYTGEYASIAIDSNDKIHLSYSYSIAPEMGLKYATNKAGSWQIFKVEIAPWSGFYTSISIDSTDKAHISYYDMGSHPAVIKYAYETNEPGAWQIITLAEVGSPTFPKGMNHLALDSDKKVHIAYYYCGEVEPYDNGCLSGDLRYVTNKSGDWQTYTIDGQGDTGWYPSIALGLDNKVHISYAWPAAGKLLYITDRSGSWQKFEVATGSNMGINSIALDEADKVHISYYSNKTLKYATNTSGSWQTLTIDSGGDVGNYNSIAVDSNNKVHISYYDFTNKDLKYATNKSGTWEIFVIDSGGDVGKYSSLAIDSDDYVHIVYYYLEEGADVHGALKYATNRPPVE